MPRAATESRNGRPSLLTKELFSEICGRIAKGEPLECICRDEGKPAARTVYDWLARDDAKEPEKQQQLSALFAYARRLGFDAIAAECLSIADDEEHDWVMTKKGPVVNEVAIGRAKLQVEARLKLLAKWDPKRYGDAPAQTNVAIGLQVQVLPEEKRTELMERHRKALEAGGE